MGAGGIKRSDGSTRIPVIHVRVPGRKKKTVELEKWLAKAFGRVPSMHITDLPIWIADQIVLCGVELLIFDDAHELTEDQFDFIRDLTDAVVSLRDGKRIGVCLVCASFGHDVPVAALMEAHILDHSWEQFLQRMHPTYKYLLINNHTMDELEIILRG